ncbi:MAG: enoyl-CoA hydratase-related protein [Thermoprotei archaeon]
MEYSEITYTVTDGVARVVFNRPNVLNAISDRMAKEFLDALRASASDPGVRVVVVTGSGRGFSAGEDLNELMQLKKSGRKLDMGERLRSKYNPIILQLVSTPKPIIASVNGVAAGAGFSIVLASDLRVASDKASFIPAFSKVGLAPDSGISFFLPRVMGYARSLEALLTGEPIDAHTAERLGLVNSVVAHEDLERVSSELAHRLAEGPGLAHSYAKRAVNYALNHTLEEALEYEASLQSVAGRTEDHSEALNAFVEKRKPIFKGR